MMEFYTANYKIRYLPIDWKRWKLESEALEQIIEFCNATKDTTIAGGHASQQKQ
jgi:hypothetical protein